MAPAWGPTWGIVSTILAPDRDVLGFAAYHLSLGAHRLYLYLDAPNPALAGVLSAHPKIKIVECDETWWARRKGKPAKHQARQTMNARHAYNRKTEVEWLAHIDVDEFLCPSAPLSEQLAALSPECLCARVRPVEALAGAPGLFKAFHLDHTARRLATEALYPTFGTYLPGGFLSHVAGKLLYRTGVEGLKAKIHNITVAEAQNPGEVHLAQTDLAHCHAASWEDWYAHFAYRHAKGSYRAELKGRGPLSPHALFAAIMEAEGEAGLRAFFREICEATPDHVAKLEGEGLLRRHDLELAHHIARHFPDWSGS